MIARASSGSSSSSSSVEPLISANSAVTVLRSPSIVEASGCSGVTRISGATDVALDDVAAGFAGTDCIAIRVPHFLQNLAPG